MPTPSHLRQLHTLPLQPPQIPQPPILLPIHKHLPTPQPQKPPQQILPIRKPHHALKYRAHGLSPHPSLERTSVESAPPGPSVVAPPDERVEESLRIWRREVVDLPREEAIFWREVPLDVDEGEDAGGVFECEEEAGETAHRVPD
ncbi:hypothetical protein GRF29_103g246916 [Pseudopithomyces chartarum]|uniref:Uncharacterized protein n=1 Tax=Pseudopithomyces chartarum TaxID=1892770 RepID=A0AAN6REJ8_9PLEO|nr:hypothetical protein GRF29_103g246916 [Pseudopithomyces chartarum]